MGLSCRAHVRSTNTILWHIVCQPHDWQHRVFDSDLLSRLYFVSPSDLLLNTHASKSTVTSWPYRHSDGSEEEKVGSYIFCFSQIWFHLWSPLEHWHSWRQSWVSYSTAPAMRRRPRSSGWRVELKKTDQSFFIDLHFVDDWQGECEDIIDIGRSCWNRGRYVERIRVGRLKKKHFLPLYSIEWLQLTLLGKIKFKMVTFTSPFPLSLSMITVWLSTPIGNFLPTIQLVLGPVVKIAQHLCTRSTRWPRRSTHQLRCNRAR